MEREKALSYLPMNLTIAVFGEATKGALCQPKLCKNIHELLQNFGQPTEESLGIFFAIQLLLYQKNVLYTRISEEGFSTKDYLKGLKVMERAGFEPIDALFLPKVGSREILEACRPFIEKQQSLLLIEENDLFDYLTSAETPS